MKKALAIILTLCMVASLLPGMALAADPTNLNGLTVSYADTLGAFSSAVVSYNTDTTDTVFDGATIKVTLDPDMLNEEAAASAVTTAILAAKPNDAGKLTGKTTLGYSSALSSKVSYKETASATTAIGDVPDASDAVDTSKAEYYPVAGTVKYSTDEGKTWTAFTSADHTKTVKDNLLAQGILGSTATLKYGENYKFVPDMTTTYYKVYLKDSDKVVLAEGGTQQYQITYGYALTGITSAEGLAVALAAAQPGDTIKLGASFTLDRTYAIEKNIVLDLNGYTLNATNSALYSTKTAFSVNTGCTLTVKGSGTITSKPSVYTEHPEADYPIFKLNGAAKLVIENGTFTLDCKDESEYCTIVYAAAPTAEIEVKNGTFNGECAFSLKNKTSVVTITDGNYNTKKLLDLRETTDEKTGITVTAGYFLDSPEEYIVAGKMLANSDKAGYTYMIKTNEAKEYIRIAADETVADVTALTALSSSEKTAVETAFKTLKASDNSPLLASAAAAAQSFTESKLEDAREKLGTQKIYIFFRPYLEIKAVSYSKGTEAGWLTTATDGTMTVNITAKYDCIASRVDAAASIDTEGDDKNAIILTAGAELAVSAPVELSLTLPSDYKIPEAGILVKHTKSNGADYCYNATVSEKKVTFTTTNGFSNFAFVAADNRTLTVNYDSGAAQRIYSITDVGSTKLETATKDKYEFLGWKFTSTDGKEITGVTGTYTTLTADLWSAILGNSTTSVTIKAVGQFTLEPTYKLTFNCNGGTPIVIEKQVKDTVIDLSKYTTTRTNYTFKGWYSDSTLTTPITKVTLSKDTTVYADWTENTEEPFYDVIKDDWYYGDVVYVYKEKIMSGESDTVFAPDKTTTRGMMVTMLYRMAGEPKVTTANPFTDVSSGAYYANAVTWAAANKIVEGYTATSFGPENLINREQMAAMLYRYASHMGKSVSGSADISRFADASTVDSWALAAVKWAVYEGLIQGDGSGLSPLGNATRAQVAAILHRFCVK